MDISEILRLRLFHREILDSVWEWIDLESAVVYKLPIEEQASWASLYTEC